MNIVFKNLLLNGLI